MQQMQELERLATIDVRVVGEADAARLATLIDDAFDESLELDDLADEADVHGDVDAAMHLRQEASAWRSTVTVLRLISRDVAPGALRVSA